MAELPHGTVTFLLTDMEGSTALWDQAPETMPVALTRHDELFGQVVAAHHGAHIRSRGEGDSCFAVFASALNAVAAARDFQHALGTEQWATPRPITVRIGLHTGHAEIRDGDYYGPTVNRCARIRSLGRGGETLLSDATVSVLRDDLPRGVGLQDLGERRLKGLARPERVFRLLDGGDASRSSRGVAARRLQSRFRDASWLRRRLVLPMLVLSAVSLTAAATIVAWQSEPETILLRDDFDRPAARSLPEVSDFPNEFAVGYGGGEYTIQSIALSQDRIPSVVLPGWYADATLSVDARVIGDPDRQSIVLGCRNIGPRSGYRLTVRPAQGSGALDRSDDVAVLTRLLPLTNVAAIRRRTAMNHLELRCADSIITAIINGTQVASVHDATYRAGRMWIGANVEAGSTVFGHAYFDNLVIRGVPTAVRSTDQVASPALLPANVPSEAN